MALGALTGTFAVRPCGLTSNRLDRPIGPGGDAVTQKASGNTPETQSAVMEILESLSAEERLILPCLQHLQRELGYITEDSVDVVAEFLNVSRAEVVGVLTYYHDLRRTPPPAVAVAVCVAEACQAQGVRKLTGVIEAEFGVALGSEMPSGEIEFKKVYCLGNCALGPAVMVNGRLLGRCDLTTVKDAIVRAREVSP